MAALSVIQDQPERLELGRGGNLRGRAIGIVVFGVVACAGLLALFDEGMNLNPVVVVVLLFVGLAFLNVLVGMLRQTRVVIDQSTRTVSRTDRLALLPPTGRQLGFNEIRNVEVTRGGSGRRRRGQQQWQAQLAATNGVPLIVNSEGSEAEMRQLAERVSTMLGIPLRESQAAAMRAQTAAATVTTAGVMPSFLDNLGAMAQSVGESSLGLPPMLTAPTYDDTSPRMRQDAAERKSARKQRRQASAAQPPPNSFSTVTPPTNADAPFVAASAQLAAEQLAFARYNAANAPSGFGGPVLAMPAMPPIFAFAPALDMPSFPPLALGFSPAAATPMMSQEVKEVSATITDSEGGDIRSDADGLTQYRNGRRLHAAHNYQEARQAYARALAVHPADAAVQNDLGVSYYQENKLHDAEAAFRRAVALDPFAAPSRYNLGLTLTRLNSKNEAHEQFKLGAINASASEVENFQSALHGSLHGPILSPQP